MACNIFDSNGNRISSSEEFVKNLYEGKLDELIKSKKIDDSKFVKKITNESGFKKEYDKLETDEEKVNFVVELARKLVASGLDKTLLKNKISNILPNVVDKITDEAVGKFLGENSALAMLLTELAGTNLMSKLSKSILSNCVEFGFFHHNLMPLLSICQL